jgi:RNA polymerase sigma-70 factor (ECF subfamily)
VERKTATGEPTDLELVGRAQSDDIEAFELLFARYKQKIANFVYHFLGERHGAEDVTQQTFIKVYRSLPAFRPTGKVSSWIYRIAANQAKDELRKRKRHPTVSLNVQVKDGESGAEMGDMLEDERQRPDHLMRERETLERVRKGLEEMKPKYKEVLLLCDYEGMSYEEAAEAIGISKTNVSAILCRARKMLAKKMKG